MKQKVIFGVIRLAEQTTLNFTYPPLILDVIEEYATRGEKLSRVDAVEKVSYEKLLCFVHMEACKVFLISL